jgi:phenylacetate-coenzyme A ligase PaaK-like adenylate-forming protein
MTTASVADLDALRARAGAALAPRLAEHIARIGWDADQVSEHQRQRLRALLAHAVERSPFHSRRLAGVKADRFELADLADLPVMTKSQMLASFDEIVTDPRLERTVVEEHLAASTHYPSLLLDDYVCLTSGGSSGVRAIFVYTIDEYADFGASTMRTVMARMMAPGGSRDGVFAMVGAASPVHSTGFAAAVIDTPVNFVSVPATLQLGEIVDRLNALQPPALSGYPSKLAQLAAEQDAGRLRIAPQSVTATSEMLTPVDRAAIGAAFGVPVTDVFGATEGLVGHSDPGGSVLCFATDMCLVEVVDDDNQPVDEGATSAKILVTNLHNLTQPLIRYEVTDRFTRYPDAPNGHLRATVEGRADELFRYGTIEVHPHIIRTVMVGASAVREYQVRQSERSVDVAVVTDGELDVGALATSIEDSLRRAGVPEPRAAVFVVDEIARHPETGKVRRFIPLGSPDGRERNEAPCCGTDPDNDVRLPGSSLGDRRRRARRQRPPKRGGSRPGRRVRLLRHADRTAGRAAELNTPFNDARPYVRGDREIVFDSDRGTQGFDIWSATRLKRGHPWSDPVNLGPAVNSAAAETRASLSRDGKTLYFGSTRGSSQDVFTSARER